MLRDSSPITGKVGNSCRPKLCEPLRPFSAKHGEALKSIQNNNTKECITDYSLISLMEEDYNKVLDLEIQNYKINNWISMLAA